MQAGKSIWKGSISFGLVSIPVALYSAIKPHVLGFNMLHSVCHHPITNKRWCVHCGKEVQWQEVVKGLKLADGSYFIITPENIKKLKPEKTDLISITEFVDREAVPPIYYESHYYVMPTKERDKAFFLLLHALDQLGSAAIGTFVMKDKEHVCAIQPYEGMLLLSTLNYDYEIRSIGVQQIKGAPQPTKAELELAQMLIKKLYKKQFDISEFKDTFAVRLMAAIKKQTKGKRIAAPEVKIQKIKQERDSLVDALKASLGAEKRASKR